MSESALPEKPRSADEVPDAEGHQADLVADVADVARVAVEQVVSVFRAESWFGPLPPPDSLAAFEQICPGAADRIIRMAEQEQSHRHGTAHRRLGITERGQLFGLIIGLTGLVVTLVLGLWGAPWVAAVIGGIDLVALVGLFVAGRLLPRREESHTAAPATKR